MMDLPNKTDSSQDQQINLTVPFPYVFATQPENPLFF